ncbi:MAG TPA: PSD1 and planctomycete cytochrome C domain-containing protein, partial [Chryseosolibacter sp.]
PKKIADLNLEVRSIFAHNCYKCHGSAKVKGKLRLDTKEYVFKGGESGDVLSVGHPAKSEMLRRLKLPRDDEDSMPPKGKTLSKTEIATLELWIKMGAPWPDSLQERSLFPLAELAPRKPVVPPDQPGLSNPIDRLVDVYFQKKDISWPESVDDRLYMRRVYLDIIGLLPDPEEVNDFLVDPNPGKRQALVKDLLSRNDDYAQNWLSFWNDALRNDYTGTGYITGGRFAITDWLYESLKENKPYDVFVRQLISPPDKRSAGFIKGIRWRGTVNASQRTEMQAAQNISQVFLGINLKCASCHDSFVSDWKLRDAYAFANIFADSTLEINRCDVPTGKLAGTRILFTELGAIDSTVSVDEKLKQLAQFLTAPANGRLYRTIVNRIWGQLMGRGIIAPADLMDNPPWSQDLLDWLASDFVENGNNLKDLIYKITTSRAYQTRSVEIPGEDALTAEDYVFRGMHRRRLSAEQFADAVSRIVFPVYPDTIKVFDPYKESGNEDNVPYARAVLVKNDGFLTALGRPNRENVLTSRSTQANLLQALELTNGERFNQALEHGAKQWLDHYGSGEAIVSNLYKQALGRDANSDEMKLAMTVLGDKPEAGAVEDLLWAVMLLPEFQLIY